MKTIKITWALLGAALLFSLNGGENLVKNPNFNKLKPWKDWRGHYDAKVSHTPDGSGSWCFDYPDSSKPGHIYQKVQVNQQTAAPLLVSAWCKAEIPGSWGKDRLNFALRTCVIFNDGSKTWRHNRAFTSGIKGWQKQEMIIETGKPVKEILLYGRFANHKGKVWFDDFTIKALGRKKFAPCKAEKVELPGKCEGIRISNGFLSLTFEPARGGRCVEFKNLLTNTLMGGTGDFPFFGGDRVSRFNYRTMLNFPFKAELRTVNDEMVQLALIKEDFAGEPYLKYTRVYTLRQNSGELQIDTFWHNRTEAMSDRTLVPHIRTAPFFSGKKSVFFIPEVNGTKLYPAESGKDTYVSNATGNFAGIGNGKGDGLAVSFDLSAIEKLYMWRGGVDKSTLELFYIQGKAPAGKDLTRQICLSAFSGIRRLDGYANGISAQINDGKVKFYSAADLAAELEITGIGNSGEKQLRKEMILLPAGKVIEFSFPRGKNDKFKAVRAALKKNKRLIFSAVRPFSSAYRLSAPPKIEKAENTALTHTISEEVKTPSIPWAKNWHRGKIRVLFVTDGGHGREIAELAQRMDLEHHTLWIGQNEGDLKWGRNAIYGSYTFADVNNELTRLLKARKYDAIVSAYKLYEKFTPQNVALIMDAVKKGTGLLMINPAAPGHFTKHIPLKYSRWPSPFKSWRQVKQHPVLSGTLPHLYLPGEVVTARVKNAEILMTTERRVPLLQLFNVEKGKCAIFGAGSAGGMLPFLPRQFDVPEYDFHEFQFVPLIKTLLHISGKLPGSAEAGVKLTGNTLTFTGGDAIEIHTRNLTSNSRRILKFKAGSRITLPLEPGVNAFHCIIRKKGKTVWFGSAASTVKPQGEIRKITIAKDFFSKGEVIKGQVTFTGKGSIRVSLIDSWGRIISRSEGASFALPVEQNSSRRMYIKAELFENKILQSALRHPIKVKIDEKMAAYEIIGTADSGGKLLHRSFDSLRWQKLRKIFGVKVVRYWGAPLYRQGLFEEQLRHGYASDFPMITGQRLKDFFKQFSEPYAKTGDKKYLHRKPCMHDPEHFNKTITEMKARFARLKGFSPVSYDFDDESSLTKWGNAYDFCYGPLTMAAFRKELQKRYRTLDKLNAAWGTKFASWEKVEPMTTPEIKKFAAKSRNYAAWAEFRDFMDEAYSSWHARVAAEARKAGVKLPFDISGTSKSNAYNGLNWYRWSKFIDQASLYHGHDEEELMRSFAKPGFRATPWFGYGVFDNSSEYRLWLDALLFQRGGASYYSNWSMLRPEFTLDEAPRNFEAATRDLRQGCGEILNMAKPVKPDVLIHFSHPSVYAYDIESRLPEFVGIRSGWLRLLTDSGLSFNFIAYADIEKGVLLKQPCRTLILPSSIAMSVREAAEIRRFMKAGGKVISSGVPGIMNEKSTLLPKSLLAGTPVKIVENPGNYPFSARRAAERKAIASHLPKPALAFSGDMSRTRVFSYTLGKTGKLFGIIRENDAQGNKNIILRMPKKYYWYDVRRSRLLDCQKDLSLKVVPAKAQMIAAFEKRLPAPVLSVKKTNRQISWQIILPGCQESTVFTVEVISPDGKVYDLYSKLAPAPQGKAQGSFTLALNDQKGKWRIRCRDRISSLKSEKCFIWK